MAFRPSMYKRHTCTALPLPLKFEKIVARHLHTVEINNDLSLLNRTSCCSAVGRNVTFAPMLHVFDGMLLVQRKSL